MNSRTAFPTPSPPDARDVPAGSERAQISQNIAAVLDLKVMLLTEQKAAMLGDLMEALRRDLPNVKNRHDPEAAALRQSMNPDLVLAALDERSEPDESLMPGMDTGEYSG